MFADEGAAAGATLLRSGDRTSFGSALRSAGVRSRMQ
jgi:hypothetical protein